MNLKRILIISIAAFSICTTATASFAEMIPVKENFSIIPDQAINVVTNEVVKIPDITAGKYNVFIFGTITCVYSGSTVAVLENIMGKMKPDAIQVIYFDMYSGSPDKIKKLVSPSCPKNLMLTTHVTSYKTAYAYAEKFNLTKQNGIPTPMIVIIDKSGIVRYAATGAYDAGSIYDAILSIAKQEEIFTPEYIKELNRISDFNKKTAAANAVPAASIANFCMPSYRIESDNAAIEKFAKGIIKDIRSDGVHSQEYLKLKALYTWVAKNIYYDVLFFPKRILPDTVIEADEVIKSKYSVCEGYANLLAAMCRAVGIPNRTVSGYAIGSVTGEIWTDSIINDTTRTNHKWNEAFVDGRWILLDVTWDSPNRFKNLERYNMEILKGQNGPGKSVWTVLGPVTYTYFDCSIEKMSEKHKAVVYEPIPTPVKQTSGISASAAKPENKPQEIRPAAMVQSADKNAYTKGIFEGKFGLYQVFDTLRSTTYVDTTKELSITLRPPLEVSQGKQYGNFNGINLGPNKDWYFTFELAGYYTDFDLPFRMKLFKTNESINFNPPVVSMKIYQKDGTLVKTLSKYGFITGLCDEGFLYASFDYPKEDVWFFISTREGRNYQTTIKVFPRVGLVEEAQLLNTFPAAAKVLGLGETK